MALMRPLTLLASVVLAMPATMRAQAQDAAPRATAVTLNPIAAVAGFLTGDVETRIRRGVTLGAGGSLAIGDEFNGYRSLEAKIRYYPNERALEGFSIAGTLGMASASGEIYDFNNNTVRTERATRGTFGTELSYQWLLGPRKRFISVLGAGIKRTLGSEIFIEPLDNRFIPTARANIGFIF